MLLLGRNLYILHIISKRALEDSYLLFHFSVVLNLQKKLIESVWNKKKDENTCSDHLIRQIWHLLTFLKKN